ncbi:hypothetical protein J6590_008431 [Homalodisca vitripennis]|nr:hypothetical protein J6590_008431 [Homalodisca vitripennis]
MNKQWPKCNSNVYQIAYNDNHEQCGRLYEVKHFRKSIAPTGSDMSGRTVEAISMSNLLPRSNSSPEP